MRGLVLKCKRFFFEDMQKSTRPKGIVPPSVNRKEDYNDAVLVLVCIEKGDKDEYSEMAAKRVDELNKQFHKFDTIVITPFAHLSSKLEEPKRAVALLEKLSTGLVTLSYKVGMVSFGTHKEVLFHLYGQPAAVSYFEFPK